MFSVIFLVCWDFLRSRSLLENPFKATEKYNSENTIPMGIMSFNLRYASADDGMNSWKFRKFHLFDIINRYHPVIMGIQEGLNDQLVEIHRNLNWPYERFGSPREEDGEHVQIFYDDTIVKKIDGGNFWLSDTPEISGVPAWGAGCVRMVTWCKFQWRSHAQVFYVFNTQFDHVSEEARNKSAVLLRNRIDHLTDPADPVFLMGDFNTYRHTYAYKYLTTDDGLDLADAWLNAEAPVGNVSYTYHGWQGAKKKEELGAAVGENHIDWILYRPKRMQILKTEVITETRARNLYPSDHYPVYSDLQFPIE